METTTKDKYNVTEAAEYLLFSRNTLYFHVRKGNILQQSDGTFSKIELDRFKAHAGYGNVDNTDEEYHWKERYTMLLKTTILLQSAFMTLFNKVYEGDLKELDINES